MLRYLDRFDMVVGDGEGREDEGELGRSREEGERRDELGE